MSLRVWLPLTKDLRNQGLDDVTVTNNGATFNSAGKLGGCYSFNGSSYITVQDVVLQNIWSYSCWLYSDISSRSWEVIMACNINGGDADMQLGLYTRPAGNVIQNTANGQYNAGIPMTYGQWNHFVGTFDGANLKTYLNGVLVNTKAITNAKLDRPKLTIGARCRGSSYDCYFQGLLNDVRIYDHCLSPMEVKELSKGLVLHYPLNRGGWGQENFILESHKVTSGGNASGITRTYESGGSMKIVSTSGNGNWCSLGFAKDSNTSVGNNMAVGDAYCISCDVKIETGTVLPTLFINSGNGYKQLKPVNGSIIIGKWMRVYYTSTWANPGTSYGNIQLHLGFSGVVGTYYFKNFKLEKGSIPTPWCPNTADANNMNINGTTEYDCSGYCNNGMWHGTHTNTSDTPKYAVSTTATGSASTYLEGPILPAEARTAALWIKCKKSQNAAIFNDKTSGLQIGLLNSLLYTNSKASTAGFTTTHWKDDDWNHVVVTYDGATRKAYINGEAESQSGGSNYYVHNADNCWLWNRSYNNNYSFSGSLSDFRIYATALSASDVKSLYQNCATIDPDGTIRGQIRS